jgi:hypothetical protein
MNAGISRHIRFQVNSNVAFKTKILQHSIAHDGRLALIQRSENGMKKYKRNQQQV